MPAALGRALVHALTKQSLSLDTSEPVVLAHPDFPEAVQLSSSFSCPTRCPEHPHAGPTIRGLIKTCHSGGEAPLGGLVVHRLDQTYGGLMGDEPAPLRRRQSPDSCQGYSLGYRSRRRVHGRTAAECLCRLQSSCSLALLCSALLPKLSCRKEVRSGQHGLVP